MILVTVYKAQKSSETGWIILYDEKNLGKVEHCSFENWFVDPLDSQDLRSRRFRTSWHKSASHRRMWQSMNQSQSILPALKTYVTKV